MPDKFEQMTENEMKVLQKAETKVDKELRQERASAEVKSASDALLEALSLLDQLEEEKNKLERREQRRERTRPLERISDNIAAFTGSILFIGVHVVLFGAWILINTNAAALGITAFDPFPFMFLTLAVSLEAIVLSSFILLSQNRQSERDRKRDEIDFERDRLDLKVDTLAAKTIREATVRISHIETQLSQINAKLDRLDKKRK